MKNSILLLILLCLVLLLNSCSSVPNHPVAKLQSDADKMFNSALYNEGVRKYDLAMDAFNAAYEDYVLLDNVGMQIEAVYAICRVAYINKDAEKFAQYYDKMEKLIDYIQPEKNYFIVLLNCDKAFHNKDWSGLIKQTDNLDFPKITKVKKLMLLTYRLQALSMKSQTANAEVNAIAGLLSSSSVKNATPDIRSNCFYVLSYYFFSTQDLVKAESYIKRALTIDHREDFSLNYANDLWLKAMIMQAKDRQNEARALLYKARNIYEVLGDTTSVSVITKDMIKTNK